MDAQEIRALLGKSIFERAQKYRKRILQSSCTTNEDGVRHLTALVQGSGPDCYYTQVWLRENGSFVSASCDCPYNQNGDGGKKAGEHPRGAAGRGRLEHRTPQGQLQRRAGYAVRPQVAGRGAGDRL